MASHGHSPGRQSVLVELPSTGTVLRTGDAIGIDTLDPDTRPAGPHDHDEPLLRESTRKLANLIRERPGELVVYSHDAERWAGSRHSPRYYD